MRRLGWVPKGLRVVLNVVQARGPVRDSLSRNPGAMRIPKLTGARSLAGWVSSSRPRRGYSHWSTPPCPEQVPDRCCEWL
jgi:hypothetical protein